MTIHNHLSVRLALIGLLATYAGCASLPSSSEETPAPSSTVGREATPEEELTLIRADSEVFGAVVRAQLDAKDDEYPYHLDRYRFDSRPYGTENGYPEIFAGVQGIDPTLSFAKAGQSAIDEVIDNRKRILDAAAIGEGGPLVYNQCAGARVPEPPPVRGNRRRTSVHAGCPKQPEYYLTVGLPIRGQPEGLRGARDTKGHRVDLRGDVWTVLVNEFSAAPRGWSKAQYAWLFRRGRWNHKLELSNTILVGVIE